MSIHVTSAVVQFVAASGPVGSDTIPIGPTWAWHGWCSTIPFDRVQVLGNGTMDGYVGMDGVRVLTSRPDSRCISP